MELAPFYKIKCLFVGEISVGKSSFVHLINHDNHCKESEPTIGLVYTVSKVQLEEYPLSNPERLPEYYFDEGGGEHQIIKMQLWDCAGSMRYRSFLSHYMREVDICFVFFDISRRETWDEVPRWIEEVKKNSKSDYLPQFVLIANKSDLRKNVTYEEIKTQSENWNTPFYLFSCIEEGAHQDAKNILYKSAKTYHETMLLSLHLGKPIPEYVTTRFHGKKDLVSLDSPSSSNTSSYISNYRQCCIIF